MNPRATFSPAWAVATASVLLVACDASRPLAGGSDDTHTVTHLTGRVLSKEAAPVPNVVVRLRHLGLSDTTDANGRFLLERSDTALAPLSDTLDYVRDGEQVTALAVPSSVWIAPDLFVVQRDFSGSIEGDVTSVSRVVATIRFPDGSQRGVELDWNPQLKRYSGYAWFQANARLDTFAVVVQTYDSAGRPLGSSANVAFTSRAGSVSVPIFGAENGLPTVTLAAQVLDHLGGPSLESSLRTGQTMVEAKAGDSILLGAQTRGFRSRIAKVLWKIGDGNWTAPEFRIHPPSDTVSWSLPYQAPSTRTSQTDIAVRFRITTLDGLVRDDSLVLRVRHQPPRARVLLQTMPGGSNGLQALPGSKVEVRLRFGGESEDPRLRRTLHLGYVQTISETTFHSLDMEGDTGWSNPVHNDSRSLEHDTTYEVFHSVLAVEVSGQDTVVTIPESLGDFQVLYRVVDEVGDSVAIRSNRIQVLQTPVAFQEVTRTLDSLKVRWKRTGLQEGIDSILICWNGICNDPYLLRQSTGMAKQISLRPPTGAASAFLRVWSHQSFGKDTTFSFEPFPADFTGSLRDPGQPWTEGGGIGGFGAVARPILGQILPGEVARLDWFRGDSTDRDGAWLYVPAANWCQTGRGLDTLSFDLASPSALDLVVDVPVRGNGNPWEPSRDTLRWTLPAGTVGHVSLDLGQAVAVDTTRPDPHQFLRENLPNGPAIPGIRISVLQSAGPRSRQGFLEVDNMGWH